MFSWRQAGLVRNRSSQSVLSTMTSFTAMTSQPRPGRPAGYMAVQNVFESDAEAGLLPTPPTVQLKSTLCVEDWVDWSLLAILVCVAFGTDFAQPRKSYIAKSSLSALSYPLQANTVPSAVVPVIAVVAPLLVILFLSWSWRVSRRETQQIALALLSSVMLTASITNCIKIAIGRPRPNFVHRCWPDLHVVWTSEDSYRGLAGCTGDASVVNEGYKSFPSGHASWTAAGLGFLCWFLFGKLLVFRGQGHVWRLVAALFPLLVALPVCISRITDYWHHWTDVVTGAGLGLTISFMYHRQYYAQFREVIDAASGQGWNS